MQLCVRFVMKNTPILRQRWCLNVRTIFIRRALRNGLKRNKTKTKQRLVLVAGKRYRSTIELLLCLMNKNKHIFLINFFKMYMFLFLVIKNGRYTKIIFFLDPTDKNSSNKYNCRYCKTIIFNFHGKNVKVFVIVVH